MRGPHATLAVKLQARCSFSCNKSHVSRYVLGLTSIRLGCHIHDGSVLEMYCNVMLAFCWVL